MWVLQAFLAYLADSGYAGHQLLCVTVVLQGPLAEEEVDLVIISTVTS